MAIGIFLFREHPEKRKQLIIALGVGIIAFFLINELFSKHILIDFTGIRERPYIAHANLITPIGERYTDSSFPSSHVAATALFMILVVREFPLLRPVAILFTLLMALSRIHNGMHYPSDVLA
jgi:membrane-associated phospholipid phosphatase